jgi:hypothetical protein
MLMGVGYEGLDWQVDEYSRRRAAVALAATVQKRMAGASVAREMERAMTEDGGLSPIFRSNFK